MKDQVQNPEDNEQSYKTKNDDFDYPVAPLFPGAVVLQVAAHSEFSGRRHVRAETSGTAVPNLWNP